MHAPGQPSEPMPSPAVLALVADALELSESLVSELEPRLNQAGFFARPEERPAPRSDPEALHLLRWEIQEAIAQIGDLRERADAVGNEPPRRFLAEARWGLTAQSLRYWLLTGTAWELAEDERLVDGNRAWWASFLLARQASRSVEALAFMVRAWVMTGPLDAADRVPPALRAMLALDELPRLQSEPDRRHVWVISSSPDPQLVRSGKISPTLFTEGPGLQVEQRLHTRKDHELAAAFFIAQRQSLDALIAPRSDGIDLLSALGSAVAGHPINLSGTRASGMEFRSGVTYPALAVDLSVVTDDLQWYLLDHAQRTLVLRELRLGLGWSQVHYAFSGDPGHALADSLANAWYRDDRDHQADPFKLAEQVLNATDLSPVRERLRAVAAERDREFAALLA